MTNVSLTKPGNKLNFIFLESNENEILTYHNSLSAENCFYKIVLRALNAYVKKVQRPQIL